MILYLNNAALLAYPLVHHLDRFVEFQFIRLRATLSAARDHPLRLYHKPLNSQVDLSTS